VTAPLPEPGGPQRGANPLGRILLVVEQLRKKVPGGIGTVAAELSRALGAIEDPAVRLRVFLFATAPPVGPDPLSDFGLGVVVSAAPTALVRRLWGLGLAKLKREVDLVHATSFDVPPSPAPLVLTVHDLAWRTVPEAYSPHGRRWHEAALRRHAARAAGFVVPSEEVAAELVGAGLGIGADRVSVIEWGADHLPAEDVEGTYELLENLGVEDGYLLAVGTLEPRKNLERLVAAYGRARDGLRRPVPLVLVGPDGWGRRPPPGEGVRFAGSVSAPVLAGLYKRARALAYVPITEGFGFPVVEAMAAGTPVLASRVPSAKDAAAIVDPTDVDAIAAGIVSVLTDERRRSELVHAGSERVKGLTWAATAAHHVELWRSLTARPG